MIYQGHGKNMETNRSRAAKQYSKLQLFIPAAKHYKLQAYARAKPTHRAVVMSKSDNARNAID